jgi:hypothetical protein
MALVRASLRAIRRAVARGMEKPLRPEGIGLHGYPCLGQAALAGGNKDLARPSVPSRESKKTKDELDPRKEGRQGGKIEPCHVEEV